MNVVNLAYFGERYKYIAKASQLLLLYQMICDERNDISASKEQLIKIFDKVFGLTISRRTLSDWIKTLAENGAIKYRYSGSARLNPFFFYCGTDEEYLNVQKEYNEFVSNIPERENDKNNISA